MPCGSDNQWHQLTTPRTNSYALQCSVIRRYAWRPSITRVRLIPPELRTLYAYLWHPPRSIRRRPQRMSQDKPMPRFKNSHVSLHMLQQTILPSKPEPVVSKSTFPPHACLQRLQQRLITFGRTSLDIVWLSSCQTGEQVLQFHT